VPAGVRSRRAVRPSTLNPRGNGVQAWGMLGNAGGMAYRGLGLLGGSAYRGLGSAVGQGCPHTHRE